MSKGQRAPSRIPEFKPVQEEAEFWDTHSTAEFEDEWEPVDFQIDPRSRSFRLMSVRLEYSLYKQLRAQAETQGLTAENLAASWIEAHLTDAARPSPSGQRSGAHDDETRDPVS
jgi:hypothetical protein